MLYPKPLKPGDKVGIIAPAGPLRENIHNEVLEAVRKMGLIPVEGESFRAQESYLAGNDQLRAGDFNKMFADKSISGVFSIRGGYGSQRIINKIDWSVVKANPKVFTGYSDITALHICLNQLCGIVAYHSPALKELVIEDEDGLSLKSFINSVTGKSVGPLQNPGELRVMVHGKAAGLLTGGNLSMLVSSLGTPYEIDTRGKILFLEEVGEAPYRLDKMLNQLKNSGKLSSANGFLIGYFIDKKSSSPKKYEEEALNIVGEYLLPMKKPCLTNICAGHRLPSITLPLGARVSIDNEMVYVY